LKITKEYFELQGFICVKDTDVMVFECKDHDIIIYNPNDNEVTYMSDDITITVIKSVSDFYKFLLLIKHDDITIPHDIYIQFKEQSDFIYDIDTFNDTIRLVSELLLNMEDYESLQELMTYRKEYYNKWEIV
jgi:hypothetical protein